MKNLDPILESKSEANFCISQMDSDVQAILMVMLCMKSALIESMPLCSNRKCIIERYWIYSGCVRSDFPSLYSGSR